MCHTNHKKPRILIAYTGTSSVFPDRDAVLLDGPYHADTFGLTKFSQRRNLRALANAADLTVFWFVGRAAFWGMFPRKPKSKIVMIIGGYEASRRSDLGYGGALSPFRRWAVRWCLQRSDRILAVSEFSKKEIIDNLNIEPGKITLLNNAVDTQYFIPDTGVRESNRILTVARLKRLQIKVKGIKLLCAVARLLPQMRFTIAGGIDDSAADKLVKNAPENIEFTGQLSIDELRRQYQKSSVYFQPSRHESFGVSVVEAMSCGCVPVVSRYGALPEVVGKAGYYLDRLEPEPAAKILHQALAAPEAARRRARQRVIDNFDIKIRAKKLYELCDTLLAE